MCARRMQNRMGSFSTATKLFIWRLRLRVQKAQPLHCWNWVSILKICCPLQISGIVLDTELSDDKDIQRQLRYQYCAANKLRASFSRCSKAVKNVLFRSFCTPMYTSQLWCNFRTSCMQRLRVAYNFGCRALYNLPWRASVCSHQVQCNIPTFEGLLRKNTYLFLERCRKSNNIWLRALMQSDCLYSSLFFEHYNRILLCEWGIEICSIRLIDGVSRHNAFAFYLDSTNLGRLTLQ